MIKNKPTNAREIFSNLKTGFLLDVRRDHWYSDVSIHSVWHFWRSKGKVHIHSGPDLSFNSHVVLRLNRKENIIPGGSSRETNIAIYGRLQVR